MKIFHTNIFLILASRLKYSERFLEEVTREPQNTRQTADKAVKLLCSSRRGEEDTEKNKSEIFGTSIHLILDIHTLSVEPAPRKVVQEVRDEVFTSLRVIVVLG